MLKGSELSRKVNEISYWMISQLSFWSVLPILSSIGSQFIISNVGLNKNTP